MELKITRNKYKLKKNDLFSIGYRKNNNKRSTLFVNKVLGKHLDVKAYKVLYHQMLLAREINDELKLSQDNFDWSLSPLDFVNTYFYKQYDISERILFIGFAETATSLGQGVFDRFSNSKYIQTTREEIKGLDSLLHFNEEHSHAKKHYLYLDKEDLLDFDRIVLIDDEITTGNTCLNIIKELKKYTPVSKFTIASILNWLSIENKEKSISFSKKYDLDINYCSLISGYFTEDSLIDYSGLKISHTEYTEIKENHINSSHKISNNSLKKKYNYLEDSGILLINSKEQQELKRTLELIDLKANDGKSIFIGYGEFMYIPLVLSYFNNGYFKAVTRSPIQIIENKGDYPVFNGFQFKALNNGEYPMFIYNTVKQYYNNIFTFTYGNLNEGLKNDYLNQLEEHYGYKITDVNLMNEKGDE